MSDPLSRFHSLHIGDMAETRAQRRRQQEQAGAAAGRRGRGRGRATTAQQPATIIPPIVGHSGKLYSIQSLSPDSSLRANEGLRSDYFVDRVVSYGTGNGIYYAFQVKKPVSVRIYDPSKGNNNRVECTCGDQIPCPHIWWLFDGLNAVFDSQSTPSTRDLPSEAIITREIGGFYDSIGDNIPTLKAQLNTTRGSQQCSGTDNEVAEELSVSDDMAARSLMVIDMLSVFHKDKLPEELESEFPESEEDVDPDPDPADMLIPESLAATIHGMAIHDESFCMRLRKVLNGDVCADYYLRKQRRRAKQAIAGLDRPSDEPPSIRVFKCGETLRRIVREVCLDREARTSIRPLGIRILNQAAELLVDILDWVCNQNRDIGRRDRDNGGIASDSPSSVVEANLYTYLISDPPPFEGGDFVIDQLRNFPENEWRHLLEHLTTTADYVRSHGAQHSVRYARKIDAMVNEYTSSAFEPSSSSHRRPASSSGRESQRRRYFA